ncbi:hypothetical protein HPB50_004661 [Hyalomma asiaticum]|uniref:Uncharacterized protein n=1 Tax=Hyalomma asiaticum TaxID=266040 RepID=A0ACB7RI84_HYAAI|nr:hypothetical protein HPB50_004661 [Hyalomma asiaticum]
MGGGMYDDDRGTIEGRRTERRPETAAEERPWENDSTAGLTLHQFWMLASCTPLLRCPPSPFSVERAPPATTPFPAEGARDNTMQNACAVPCGAVFRLSSKPSREKRRHAAKAQGRMRVPRTETAQPEMTYSALHNESPSLRAI